MGLVNELQESAEREDVVTVVRKAKRLSSKLGLREISEWLDHEQNGYPRADAVPAYRRLGGSLCYNTNGYIPAGFGMVQRGIMPLTGFDLDLSFPLIDPISRIMGQISGIRGEKQLYVQLDAEIAEMIRGNLQSTFPGILNQLTFLLQLNEGRFRDVPEQVKNKIHGWACNLESAGVTGEGVSFSAAEKKIAQNIVFNITHSSIDQLSSSGTNIKRTI